MKTYSAAEVAEQLVGDSMKNPEGWVVRQIKSGRFRAMKVGRKYRFTEEQLNAAIQALTVGGEPSTAPVDDEPQPMVRLSAGSRRMRLPPNP